MAEKFENIVSSEGSEQTIDKPTQAAIEPPVKAPKDNGTHGSLPSGVGLSRPAQETDFHRDIQYHEGIDVEKFKDDINKGAITLGTGGIDALINERAEAQGFGTQLKNMVGQAVEGEIVGGTIQGLGYLLEVPKAIDYMNGTEREFGNLLTDIGEGLREHSQDFMPIYQRTDSDWHDSGWWASNGVSVASSLSMMLPSMAATKALGMLGKGMSRGMGMLHESLDIASKMGKMATWATEGIAQAIVSRHIENAMEASGVFKEQKEKLLNTFNPKTGKLFTEEEASAAAGEGASSTYNANWAMLLQDIPQYLAIGKVFNPATMQMEKAGQLLATSAEKSAAKAAENSLLGKVGALAESFVSEGAEESYQYYMAERGKLLSDRKANLISDEEFNTKLGAKIGDKEMLTSAFWGGLGGVMFEGIGGAANELFKSKERRSMEDNYAQMQGDAIKARGQAFVDMNNEIKKADQTNDPIRRMVAVNQSTMTMALDALANNSIDQHIEMLNNMEHMTPEEAKAFAAQTGEEVNLELLKAGIPEARKQALELRKDYLKNIDKKFDPNIAASITGNDYHIKQFAKRDKELAGEMQETKASIPDIGELSGHYTEIANAKHNIVALKRVNEIHKQAINNTKSTPRIEARKKLIEDNSKRIEELSKKVKTLEQNETRDADQIRIDKRVGAGYKNVQDDLLSAIKERALLKDATYLAQQENVHLKSKDYQAKRQVEVYQNTANAIANKDGIVTARKNVAANTTMSAKDKELVNSMIDKREVEIEKEEKAKEAQAKRAGHAAKLEEEKRKELEASTGSLVPAINSTPIGTNIEDEFGNEEPNLEGKKLEQENAKKSIMSESSANAKVYSEAGSDVHKAWRDNGENKVGKPATVVPHKEVYAGNQNPQAAHEAIKNFDRALKGEKLTEAELQVIYDYLPLKTVFDNDQSNFAFISSRLVSTEKGQAWNRQDLPTRKAYINHMIHNKTESYNAKIVVQYGGELMRDEATGGVIPENNIGDFHHLKPQLPSDFDSKTEKEQLDILANLISKDLMYTNENGVLFSTSTKQSNSTYHGTQVILPGLPGTGGQTMFLAGGVFLNTNKVDGTPFPLKLNLVKSSDIEADTIIDLMKELVTNGNPNQKLSELPQQLQDKLNQNFGEVGGIMQTLFSETADPNILQLIGSFVYMDAATKGKTSELRFTSENKVNMIVFSEKGNKFTSTSSREELKKFLTEVKRKQFDVNRWRSSAAYRRYAIKSGLLNTDAVVDQPLFQGRRDIYISSPNEKSVIEGLHEMAVQSPAKMTVDQRREFSKTSKAKVIHGNKVSVPYIDAKGTYSQIIRDTEAQARQDVELAYNNQQLKTAAKTQVIATKQAAVVAKAIDNLDSEESVKRLALIEKVKERESQEYEKFLTEAYKIAGIAVTPEQVKERVNQHMNAKYSIDQAGNSFGKYVNQINNYTRNVILKGVTDTFQHYKDPVALAKIQELYKGFEEKQLAGMSYFENLKDTRTKATVPQPKTKVATTIAQAQPITITTTSGGKTTTTTAAPPAITVTTTTAKPKTQMSKEELNAMMGYKPEEDADKEEDTRKQEVTLETSPGVKNTYIMQENGLVANKKTGKLAVESIQNMFKLKSGHYKYKSINIKDNSGNDKGTYAVVIDPNNNVLKIINITKGSKSNGKEVTRTSPVGKKVMEGYNTSKQVTEVKPIEAKPVTKDFSTTHPMDMVGETITATTPFDKDSITGKVVDWKMNPVKKGLVSLTLDNGEIVSHTEGTNSFTWVKGMAKPVEVKPAAKPVPGKMTQEELNKLMSYKAEEESTEEDLEELQNAMNEIESTDAGILETVNTQLNDTVLSGNTEIVVSLADALKALEMQDEHFDDVTVETDVKVDKKKSIIPAVAAEDDISIIDGTAIDFTGGDETFDWDLLNDVQEDVPCNIGKKK